MVGCGAPPPTAAPQRGQKRAPGFSGAWQEGHVTSAGGCGAGVSCARGRPHWRQCRAPGRFSVLQYGQAFVVIARPLFLHGRVCALAQDNYTHSVLAFTILSIQRLYGAHGEKGDFCGEAKPHHKNQQKRSLLHDNRLPFAPKLGRLPVFAVWQALTIMKGSGVS